jgi:hypothetical protein
VKEEDYEKYVRAAYFQAKVEPSECDEEVVTVLPCCLVAATRKI